MEELSFAVDCREMTSRAAVHDTLARTFALPAYYGRNLDALYDCLTALPPCVVHLENRDALYENLGPYAEKLLAVFRDAAAENPGLRLTEA